MNLPRRSFQFRIAHFPHSHCLQTAKIFTSTEITNKDKLINERKKISRFGLLLGLGGGRQFIHNRSKTKQQWTSWGNSSNLSSKRDENQTESGRIPIVTEIVQNTKSHLPTGPSVIRRLMGAFRPTLSRVQALFTEEIKREIFTRKTTRQWSSLLRQIVGLRQIGRPVVTSGPSITSNGAFRPSGQFIIARLVFIPTTRRLSVPFYSPAPRADKKRTWFDIGHDRVIIWSGNCVRLSVRLTAGLKQFQSITNPLFVTGR